MKAAIYTQYGPPDVVQIKEIEKPIPKGNEVLLKVRAASINPLDCGLPKGAGRIVTGLWKPQITRLGVDMAGQVDAVGDKVTRFKVGCEVFGVCIRNPQDSALKVWVCQGAFAEYACAPESALVLKPTNVTFEQAASVPVAALTALQGLRDKGHIQPGHRVLINGAAGGVGTFAVQISKFFRTEVTAVCSTKNVDMVRSIGADHVVDYTQGDFTTGGRPYDLIFDCVGNHPLSAYQRALGPKGTCVMVGDQSGRGMFSLFARLIGAFLLSSSGKQKLVTFLARPNKDDLAILHDLMKTGKVVPVIDRCYKLTEISEAIRYLEKRHARGKVVLTLD